jgi:hypothetical protein
MLARLVDHIFREVNSHHLGLVLLEDMAELARGTSYFQASFPLRLPQRFQQMQLGLSGL